MKKKEILIFSILMMVFSTLSSQQIFDWENPKVVDINKETTVLGGAGNVINNLKALGADVSVAGVIGDDANGAIIANV